MSNCVKNCHHPEILQVLIDGIQAKQINLAELSLGYLESNIKNSDHSVFEVVTEQLKYLFKQLYIEIEGKRMKMKKGAESIMKLIREKVGEDNMISLLKASLLAGEDDTEGLAKVEKVLKLFEQKEVAKADKSKDFRSFLKQQKQQPEKSEDQLV